MLTGSARFDVTVIGLLEESVEVEAWPDEACLPGSEEAAFARTRLRGLVWLELLATGAVVADIVPEC